MAGLLRASTGAPAIVRDRGPARQPPINAPSRPRGPGEYVFFGAGQAADGKVTPTGGIQVSKDGVRPRC